MVIPIINDNIAEPRKSFICTLQGGTDASIQNTFPSQVIINIDDDDGEQMHMLWFLKGKRCVYLLFLTELIVRWTTSFYEFRENEIATLELVTDSLFEVSQVTIQGGPRWIPDSDPSTLPSLEVLGPVIFPGNREPKLNVCCTVTFL